MLCLTFQSYMLQDFYLLSYTTPMFFFCFFLQKAKCKPLKHLGRINSVRFQSLLIRNQLSPLKCCDNFDNIAIYLRITDIVFCSAYQPFKALRTTVDIMFPLKMQMLLSFLLFLSTEIYLCTNLVVFRQTVKCFNQPQLLRWIKSI